MQKFTRALTREIEIGSERLAVTLDAEGLTVRPVGSRRPPHKLSWAACMCAVAGEFASEDPPPPEEMAAAIKAIKAGAPKDEPAKDEQPASAAAPPHPEAPVPPAEAHSPVSSASPSPAHADSSVPSLLARVDRWLAVHRERFHRGLLPGASDAELAELKESLGGSLPDELQDLLRWHSGQSADVPGALEQNWSLMSARKIASSKKELDQQPPPGWRAGLLPILEDGAGSFLVLAVTEPGHPVLAFWKGTPEVNRVAPSLTAWLQEFATALEAGRYHEDPERGTLHRTH